MAKAFSGMLVQLRQESGVSQRDASAALGISQSLLSHYEKGSREPRLDFVIRAAAYYHVTTDYLLGCSSDRTLPAVTDALSEKHRSLLDGLQYILCRLEEEEDAGFAEAAGQYLTLALYKVCRYLCLHVCAASALFSSDADCFPECADAAMRREEVAMKRWARRQAHKSRLAAALTTDSPEPLARVATAVLLRGEHLMGDCMPLA